MILASATPLSLFLALGAIAAYLAAVAGAARWWSSTARLLTWLAWSLHGAMWLPPPTPSSRALASRRPCRSQSG